jgi:NodT family efflux transporter outer membrane factor (OMF) lipoprotein
MGKRIFSLVVCFVGIAGCAAVGPDYEPVEPAVPASFGSLQPGIADSTAVPSQLLVSWWDLFDDPVLASLVERAVQSNLDLRIAEARVRQARALRGVASARYFPEGEGSVSYQRYRTSENNAGGGFAGGDVPGGPRALEDDLYQAGFAASWEIDIFGGIRREVEAANAELAASQESLRDTLVTVQGEVARNYVELRALQLRLDIARKDVASRQENVEMTAARVEAGLVNELDLARSQGALSTVQSTIPLLEQLLRAAMYRLGVLLGQEPLSLVPELETQAEVPPVPKNLPTGLPSDLLRRRPDIRRAERQMAAATAKIGVSTAELFPRFSLTGSFGLQSNDKDDLVDDGSDFWSMGPAFRWNILNLKRILSNIAASEAVRDEALSNYEKTVLLALEEVENALVTLSRQKRRAEELTEAVVANQVAVDLAWIRYRAGLESYLAYLDAQTGLRISQDQLALSKRDAAVGLVALYKALGGGWQSPSHEAEGDNGDTGAERLSISIKEGMRQ